MINKKLYKFCGNTKKYIVYAVIVDSVKLIVSVAFAYLFAFIVSGLFKGICVT